jgi:hypothetical protein
MPRRAQGPVTVGSTRPHGGAAPAIVMGYGFGYGFDCAFVSMYYSTKVHGGIMMEVERVQTGIRIEKRLLKVLKALAELKDLSLGDLLEGMVLHAFDGKVAFSKETLSQIAELRKIYHMPLRAGDSHKLKDKPA